MTDTTAEAPGVNGTPQKPQAGVEQHPRGEPSINKFEAARMAKKKQKRARHRARLRRSHTDG